MACILHAASQNIPEDPLLGTDIFDSGPTPAKTGQKPAKHQPTPSQNLPTPAQNLFKPAQNQPNTRIFDSGRVYPLWGRMYIPVPPGWLHPTNTSIKPRFVAGPAPRKLGENVAFGRPGGGGVYRFRYLVSPIRLLSLRCTLKIPASVLG